jgi:hypothetical protein
MLAHRLLLLIAILASLAVLGTWDNQRQIERVLADGYETLAQVTGARYQRGLPLTVDGWRPRLVEQELSVNLKWQGRDGNPREAANVPITDNLARGIVSGDQVRLVTLPIKALDDGTAPVIRSDVSARLASLQSWLTIAGYIALASWAGFAGLTVWLRRNAASKLGPVDMPLKRTILGIVLLFGGGFMAFYVWSEGDGAARQPGVEVTAEIIEAAGGRVRLAWKGEQGAVHHFGPVAVSEAYWKKITRNGELVVRQATIRYQPGEPTMRPVIVDDAPAQSRQSQFGTGAGIVLMLLGAALLYSAMRHVRRAARR